MNKPMMEPRRTRAMMAALWVTVLAGGAACNAISGADSVEFTGEPTGSVISSSSSSSSGSGGSSTSSSSSSGGGTNGDPGACPGESMSINLGQTLPLISGNTTGATDKFTGSNGTYDTTVCPHCDCMASTTYSGPDMVYAITPSASGTLNVTLVPSYDDWQFNVRTTCSGNKPSDEVACTWGNFGGAYADKPGDLSIAVTQGTTYYVVANSWNGSAVGTFDLHISLQ